MAKEALHQSLDGPGEHPGDDDVALPVFAESEIERRFYATADAAAELDEPLYESETPTPRRWPLPAVALGLLALVATGSLFARSRSAAESPRLTSAAAPRRTPASPMAALPLLAIPASAAPSKPPRRAAERPRPRLAASKPAHPTSPAVPAARRPKAPAHSGVGRDGTVNPFGS
jgi:hypothetical protein